MNWHLDIVPKGGRLETAIEALREQSQEIEQHENIKNKGYARAK